MKNKGFSLIEIMIVALISASFLGIIFSVFLIGRNSWAKSAVYIDLQEKTRLAMDKIASELSLSNASEITIKSCSSNPPTGFGCYGDWIEFKVPIVNSDTLADTVYNADGTIKFGVNKRSDWAIKYFVSATSPNIHRLIRVIPEETTTPPVEHWGACCVGKSCAYVKQTQCSDVLKGIFYQGWTCNMGSYNNPCDPADDEDDDTGGGGTCFLSGTPILMADGSTKAIEEIKPKDTVMAFNEKTGKFIPDKVKKFFEHQANAYLIINEHLKITPNHPVYSNGKWVKIGRLKVGDSLVNAQGKPEKITSIEKITKPAKVYNIEVNPYHTYIAGGIVAHNKTGGVIIGGDGRGGGVSIKDLFDFLRKCFSQALALADTITTSKITIIAGDIKEMTIVNPNYPGLPDRVQITITAEKKSMLGETAQFTLTSTIFLRN